MPKILEIHCASDMKDIIVDALRLYAKMAFPDSGSPCQMVSRDTLFTAADEFEAHFEQAGTGVISSRMRVMLKAAIKNYFKVLEQQTGRSTERQCRLILDVCTGRPGIHQGLSQARAKDESSDIQGNSE